MEFIPIVPPSSGMRFRLYAHKPANLIHILAKRGIDV